ncbi:MAG: hypothetical protein H6710_14940 [Myxococcales bacterium]|nr:hypothetical protein [Myxococcales bacterium]MCB9702028.1 hypothetical protein [Myxococcales bacterium]
MRLRTLASSALTLLLAGGLTACPASELVPPEPDLIGISIPIPPPSLFEAPVQRVDVQGDTTLMDPVPETLVFLYEHSSGRGYFVFAEGSAFTFTDVELDLTDNCMQVWYEEPGEDGHESPFNYYRASIADDDQTIDLTKLNLGCP